MSNPAITWGISKLDYEISDGFVFTAYWNATLSDGTDSVSSYGAVNLERPDNLIPYDSLTEDIVVNWVKQELGKDSQIEQIEAGLAYKLSEKKRPSSAAGLPWAPVEEPAIGEDPE